MIKINRNNTKTFIVSGSRARTPAHRHLVLDGMDQPVSDSLVVLGLTFDSKMTFQQHIMNVTSSAAR